MNKQQLANEYKRRALVNIFINAIYLYDGYFTMILNAGNRPLSVENIPLDDIEKAFENDDVGCSSNSQLVADAPPRRRGRHIVRGDFLSKVTSHSFCRGSFPNRTRSAGLLFGFGAAL